MYRGVREQYWKMGLLVTTLITTVFTMITNIIPMITKITRKFKLVFLGEQSVGKTSLITRSLGPS